MKRWLWLGGLAAALMAVGLGSWKFFGRDNGSGQYRTAQVERGEVVQTVRATGVVQPIRLVQVGTQVNGPVSKLFVDYNDRVKEGDLVAQIDPTVYEARLAQDQANLNQAEAQVEQVQAKLTQADGELERADKLAGKQMISNADLETATANRDSLKAQMKVAKAAVEQAKATLRLSRANLDYTTIRSPVNGVVIARNVSEGQTVVASMSAQVLFMIATDLRVVQVEASIPEADIGKIQAGQPVKFTVDAYDRPFRGKVSQVRMSAASVQNVVTYPVIISAENPDNKLFPSMTANISCEVARRSGVLKVPNAALRFKPPPATVEKSDSGKSIPDRGSMDKATSGKRGRDESAGGVDAAVNPPAETSVVDKVASEKMAEGVASGEKTRGDKTVKGERGRGGGRLGGDESGGAGFGSSAGKVWIQVKPGAQPESVSVSLGASDGSFTEVLEPAELKEGQAIITGYEVSANPSRKPSEVVNPFAPPTPPGMRRTGR